MNLLHKIIDLNQCFLFFIEIILLKNLVMKNLVKNVSALLILFLFFISCNFERDDNNKMYANGKVINQITKKPLVNTKIYFSSSRVIGSGVFSYIVTDFQGYSITDSEGRFQTKISYKSIDSFFEFGFNEDDIHTGAVGSKTTFSYEDLQKKEELIFFYRNWEKLDISVINKNPLDENDQIRVYILQDKTNYINSPIYSIENFGNINEANIYPAANDGLQPLWKGKNVNSIIHCKIQNDTEYTVFWYVKKNGIDKEFISKTFNTNSGELNKFEINY